MLFCLVSIIIGLLTNSTSVVGAEIIQCVKPSEFPDIQCQCPSEANNRSHSNYCYTLNDWIGSTKASDQNLTVRLLHGVHRLNFTKERQMENSVTLTGGNQEKPIEISCIQSMIHFSSGHNLEILNITFSDCTVVLSFINNIKMNNVTMISGKLIIDNQMLDFHFTPHNYQQDNNLNLKEYCEHQERVDILWSIFQNSTIVIQGSTDVLMDDYLYTSCLDVCIRKTQLESVSHNGNPSAISFYYAYSVILSDMVIRNSSSSQLYLFVTNVILFEGYNLFSWNHGRGINIIIVGSIHIKSNTELNFIGNTVFGHLFHVFKNVLNRRIGRVQPLEFQKSAITFKRNRVEKGSILVLESIILQMNRMNLTFENNTSLMVTGMKQTSPMTIFLLKSSEVIIHNSKLLFIRNIAAMLSGGITFSASTCRIKNITATFDYNSGIDGGALAFYDNSYVGLEDTHWEFDSVQTTMLFRFNRAQTRGGAIFVDDSDYTDVLTTQYYDHFIQVLPTIQVPINVNVYFSNNTAEVAGDDIYGGWIDTILAQLIKLNLTGHPPQIDSLHAVTSDPIRVCICIHSLPMCNVTEYQTEIFPGESFEIEAVAVGQRMGIVPSVVSASFADGEGRLGTGEDVQTVGKQCTALKFTVYTSKKKKSLELSVQKGAVPNFRNLFPLLYQEINFTVRVRNCPLGYVFDEKLLNCQCLKQMERLGVKCNHKTFTVLRKKQQWLSSTMEHVFGHNYGVIAHNHCPYDYCRTDPDSLSFHLELSDDQCAFNRSGILCGACQANFSQILGSSKCVECSNIMVFAIIPTSIITGVLLVVFLTLFNLTVSLGTINGLIFYANIIRSSQAVFFPPEFNAPFLSTFIAWLNLDLGIEVCFYNGLDAYGKIWFQYVFPVYIWLLVIIIIVASHYSTIASKFTPNNAVQVLATLFLLSYAKILQIVITVFSSTILIYPDNFKKRVWLYDSNMEFLTGKHIPLFIATLLMLILLSIPYTLTLINIQLLQRISHYRFLSWVHRLMPLFDAYTGPYKHKHRYWTGLLLLIRVILLTTFSLNQTNNPSINLLAIAVMAFLLLAYLSFVGGVYKSWVCNILEIAFILNAGVASVAVLYQPLNGNHTALVATISTGVAFTAFAATAVCHAIQQLLSLKGLLLVKWGRIIIAKIHTKRDCKKVEEPNSLKTGDKVITHTSVELCEPLI